MAVNDILFDSAGNLRGFDSRTLTLWLRQKQIFDVVGISRKTYNSYWCNVFGVVAASLIGLFYPLMCTAGKIVVANCTYFGQAGLSRVLVRRSLLSISSGWSIVASRLRNTGVTVG